MVRVGRESSRHQTTSVVSPKVQTMAMPDPLSGSASSWARTGTRTPNSGVTTVGAEQGPVALVVGVGDQGHAGRQQLGPGGLDLDGAVAADPGEAQPVVGAGALAVLELGLGDGGPEVDVPQGGGRALDHLAAPGQAEEAPLGDPLGPLGDGGVGVGPVDRQPERAPQVLEDLLVLGGEPVAEGHEVGPRDGDRVLRRARPAARSRGRRGGSGRTGPRSSSGPGVRWADRCRPIPSGRRPARPRMRWNRATASVWV